MQSLMKKIATNSQIGDEHGYLRPYGGRRELLRRLNFRTTVVEKMERWWRRCNGGVRWRRSVVHWENKFIYLYYI